VGRYSVMDRGAEYECRSPTDIGRQSLSDLLACYNEWRKPHYRYSQHRDELLKRSRKFSQRHNVYRKRSRSYFSVAEVVILRVHRIQMLDPGPTCGRDC